MNDASVSSAGLVDMDFVFAGSDGSKGWKGAFSANLDLAVRVPYRGSTCSENDGCNTSNKQD